MAIQAHSMAARLSKFKVGELALKSALQLERARAGISYDKSQLSQLAEALRVSAGEVHEEGRVAYMRPGYFEPFERVYRSSHKADPTSIDEIRQFVIETIESIESIDSTAGNAADSAAMKKLVDFCLQLNREFVQRKPAENRVGRRQRSVAIEAFVR